MSLRTFLHGADSAPGAGPPSGADFASESTALRARFADLSAMAGVRRAVLTEGRSNGLEVAEVRNGLGLRFDVLVGRGMDIGFTEYRGLPLSWRSTTGDVAPQYFDPHGIGWLRSFHGGLLVGCGLRHVGAPSFDGEEQLGVHGRLSNTPAESVVARMDWDAEEPAAIIAGRVSETRVLGEDLRLNRVIRAPVWANRIIVDDRVTNDGADPSPHMYLLHINLGFPVVSELSRLLAPILETVPRDAAAAARRGGGRVARPGQSVRRAGPGTR